MIVGVWGPFRFDAECEPFVLALMVDLFEPFSSKMSSAAAKFPSHDASAVSVSARAKPIATRASVWSASPVRIVDSGRASKGAQTLGVEHSLAETLLELLVLTEMVAELDKESIKCCFALWVST